MRDTLKSALRHVTWDRFITYLLMIAGMVAVIYFSQDRGADKVLVFIAAAVGIAGVYYCRKAADIAANAWYQRRAMKFAAGLVLLAAAYTIEGNNHFSVGSHNQDELTASRVAAKQSYDDRLNEANRAGARVLELRQEVAWKTELPPVEAIQAKIDAAKAHKFFRVNTTECTVMKGPETTRFCRELRQLEADKAMALRKLQIAEELKVAEAEHAKAKAKLEGTHVVTTTERADVRNIKKVAAFFGVNNFDVEFSNALLMFMGLCLFLSLREWLHVAEQYEGKPLRPWPFMQWARNKWRGVHVDEPAAMSLPEANSAREIVTSTPPSHHVGIRKATIAQLARIAQAA